MTRRQKKNNPWDNFKLGRSTGKKGKPKRRILILCEGEKTEPNYFRAFRVTSVIIDVLGLGANTTSLVEEAIKQKKEAKEKNEPFEEIWCVFDRDSNPKANFNKAFELAKRNNIHIAYSNEAFELWYLLHFSYLNTGISRKLYKAKLTESMRKTYEKNSTTIYEELLPMQSTAIKFAKKLIKTYPTPNPEKDNPSTTVFLLVEKLNANK